MKRSLTRREMLGGSAAALAALAAGGTGGARGRTGAAAGSGENAGRLKQSVSRWPYASIPLPDFARECARMGLQAIDLLQPDEWAVVRDAGLTCSMGYPTARRDFIATGFNNPAHHAMLLRELERTIPLAARAGVPNVIAMFGNRLDQPERAAIANCVHGLSQIKRLAEEQSVTVCVELLNSKVDHAGYQGDRTAFGVDVVRAVDSPRVKLLYDIYHMQIMEGDVIRTIREHIRHIAHFHTGGVPGRHELDETQELNYRAVARAIADLGFTGYVAHEFVPTRDKLVSLREAVGICTV